VESAVLRKRFADTAVADVLRAVDGGAEMGANALALCLPDYLSYLRDPSPLHNKRKYKKVVQDYLAPSTPDIYPPRYTPFDARSSMCTARPAQ
jgi:hypothetical protein